MLKNHTPSDLPIFWDGEKHILEALGTLPKLATGFSDNIEKIIEKNYGKNVIEVLNEDGSPVVEPATDAESELQSQLKAKDDEIAQLRNALLTKTVAAANSVVEQSEVVPEAPVENVEEATSEAPTE